MSWKVASSRKLRICSLCLYIPDEHQGSTAMRAPRHRAILVTVIFSKCLPAAHTFREMGAHIIIRTRDCLATADSNFGSWKQDSRLSLDISRVFGGWVIQIIFSSYIVDCDYPIPLSVLLLRSSLYSLCEYTWARKNWPHWQLQMPSSILFCAS